MLVFHGSSHSLDASMLWKRLAKQLPFYQIMHREFTVVRALFEGVNLMHLGTTGSRHRQSLQFSFCFRYLRMMESLIDRVSLNFS